MFIYHFDIKNNTAKKTWKLSFFCNTPISYEEFIEMPELNKKLKRIDKRYRISDGLYLALMKWLDESRVSDRLRDYITKKRIWQLNTEVINLVGTTFGEHSVSPMNDNFERNEEIFTDLLNLSKKESEIYEYSSKESSQRNVRDYLIFLYLTKKERLFWCIDPINQNIDIADSWNLHRLIQNKALIVLPVDEYYYRWKALKNAIPKSIDYQKKTRTENIQSDNKGKMSDEAKKTTAEFDKEVLELQSAHPNEWLESLLVLCKERLEDARTSKIEINSKKRYRLIKPTIKYENVDATIAKSTTDFWKVEKKFHTTWSFTKAYEEYSPTHIVYKSWEESI